MILDLIHRIKRKLMKMRVQPIRVFCFHQVSEVFDASTMYPSDWTQIEQFKHTIMRLKVQYTFISLTEAQERMKHQWFRTGKYAVLTADDGWASLKNILPWLSGLKIPVTLFVNPAYLKGEDTRENGMSGLLNEEELKELIDQYPKLTIGSHGWNHTFAIEMDTNEFEKDVLKSQAYLLESGRYVPYYAYPCGYYTSDTDDVLRRNHIIPVYIDGEKNFTDSTKVHRELLDGLSL